MKKRVRISAVSLLMTFMTVLPVSYMTAYSAEPPYTYFSAGKDDEGEVIVPDFIFDKPVTSANFEDNDKITTVYLHDKIEHMWVDNCPSIKAFYVDENNPYLCSVDGVLYDKDKTKLICYPSAKEDENYEIADSVWRIEEKAFFGAKNLRSVELPDKLSMIDEYAFADTKISAFDLPESLGIVEYGAFFGNDELESIIIPESVQIIYSAFEGCSSLKNIVLMRKDVWEYVDDTSWGGGGRDCYRNLLVNGSDITVYVPDESYEMYQKYNWDENNRLSTFSDMYGDVNCDGEFNISDLVLFRKWLLNADENKLGNWKAADFSDDNKLDIFDMIAMRKKLIDISK